MVSVAAAAAASSSQSPLCTHQLAVFYIVTPQAIWGRCNLMAIAWVPSGPLTEVRRVFKVGDRNLEKTLILQ
jgi:hypothetical protein